jgi:hypothetical protein
MFTMLSSYSIMLVVRRDLLFLHFLCQVRTEMQLRRSFGTGRPTHHFLFLFFWYELAWPVLPLTKRLQLP